MLIAVRLNQYQFDALVETTAIRADSLACAAAKAVLVGGMEITDAAEVVGISRPTVAKVVKRLIEQLELIERFNRS